eukprot:TRINITY_DN21541_c1_g1_i1.p1 TRINITY_DN21541_c1_g1~~TRINITY_DN21541_c1_g1_i1.p1  ORF type:complete len:102 (+),score=14.47 TRINITY_DN21541_c1_g1_i1:133-438(+)
METSNRDIQLQSNISLLSFEQPLPLPEPSTHHQTILAKPLDCTIFNPLVSQTPPNPQPKQSVDWSSKLPLTRFLELLTLRIHGKARGREVEWLEVRMSCSL